jgi:hypothetical protein
LLVGCALIFKTYNVINIVLFHSDDRNNSLSFFHTFSLSHSLTLSFTLSLSHSLTQPCSTYGLISRGRGPGGRLWWTVPRIWVPGRSLCGLTYFTPSSPGETRCYSLTHSLTHYFLPSPLSSIHQNMFYCSFITHETAYF